MFPKVAQKVAASDFYLKVKYFKNAPNILATFA